MLTELINTTPYVSWKEGESTLSQNPPFYCLWVPTVVEIRAAGCNCAGLVNLLQLSNGRPVPGVATGDFYAGGTDSWHTYLKEACLLEPFDNNRRYPPGALLLRRYRDPIDQGHMAIIYDDDQKLLHSYYGAGITIDRTVASSHEWRSEGYYEFVWPRADLLAFMRRQPSS